MQANHVYITGSLVVAKDMINNSYRYQDKRWLFVQTEEKSKLIKAPTFGTNFVSAIILRPLSRYRLPSIKFQKVNKAIKKTIATFLIKFSSGDY